VKVGTITIMQNRCLHRMGTFGMSSIFLGG
jgi:hypothetical protein